MQMISHRSVGSNASSFLAISRPTALQLLNHGWDVVITTRFVEWTVADSVGIIAATVSASRAVVFPKDWTSGASIRVFHHMRVVSVRSLIIVLTERAEGLGLYSPPVFESVRHLFVANRRLDFRVRKAVE